MSSSEEGHLSRLTGPTPRMPQYLRGAADTMMSRTEVVAETVSHFLRNPVRLGDANVRRCDPKEIEDQAADMFDLVDHAGKITMRLGLSAATISSVTRSLFGGDVTEKPVLSGIGLSFCRQVAATLLSGKPAGASSGGDDDDDVEEADPLEGYSIIKAEPGTIGHRPLLAMSMKLSLIQPPDLEITAFFPRGFSDKLSAPDRALGDALLQVLSFPITAIAGRTKVPFGEMRKWKAGDEIQLPGAELSKMQLMVSAGTKTETLAYGELGAADGAKSIRVNEIAAKPTAVINRQAAG
ncbi:FliM/FliN family flagellar motor switch protein [Parvularcula marina]|uniref:FliM/FliN family flagellar motor switch protein n=1 Tax=Parvularcula marina TaxID=2292771 RepID=A0A371RH13_9PROT|nr:FliM/FliN family flagellar motor C-terminal domain-containing protein [Parvularcula marina]RFB04748.1 FliM/FliN family flagellar motor switch protein [Parvularcula marina]